MIDLNPEELDAVADEIMLIDGDRDHMNHSKLTCEQTQQFARFLRALAHTVRGQQ